MSRCCLAPTPPALSAREGGCGAGPERAVSGGRAAAAPAPPALSGRRSLQQAVGRGKRPGRAPLSSPPRGGGGRGRGLRQGGRGRLPPGGGERWLGAPRPWPFFSGCRAGARDGCAVRRGEPRPRLILGGGEPGAGAPGSCSGLGCAGSAAAALGPGLPAAAGPGRWGLPELSFPECRHSEPRNAPSLSLLPSAVLSPARQPIDGRPAAGAPRRSLCPQQTHGRAPAGWVRLPGACSAGAKQSSD